MKPAANAAAYLVAAVIAGGSATLIGTRAFAADPQASAASAPAPEATPAPATTTATPESTCETPAPTAPTSTAIDAGMRAYIDPETGQLTSQPSDQIPHPGEPALPVPPVLMEEVLPDGSVMIDLQGTLQDYMILEFDANGALVMRCSNDAAATSQAPSLAPKREDR